MQAQMLQKTILVAMHIAVVVIGDVVDLANVQTIKHTDNASTTSRIIKCFLVEEVVFIKIQACHLKDVKLAAR